MSVVHASEALSQALAEPSRRAILEALRYGRKSVSELVEITQLKQPNVSNHLAKMRREGIVRAERNGRNIYYVIAMPIADFILRMHEYAFNPLGNVEYPSLMEAEPPSTGAPHWVGRQGEFDVPDLPAALKTGARDELASGTVTLAEWRTGFFRCLGTGDEKRANALVGMMLARRMEIETIYGEIFQWAMTRIGEKYIQGLIGEAHEHLATEMVERMMAKVSQFYSPIGRNGRESILGCVVGNYHSLGLRMLSDALNTRGWETRFLGANVPTDSFASMVAADRTDLVVVSCAMEEHVPEAERLLRRLHALRETGPDYSFEIAVGGAYINAHPDAMSGLRIDFTSPGLTDFCRTVDLRFGKPQTRSRH